MLDGLLASLFSVGETHDPNVEWMNRETPMDFTEVTSEEIRLALRRGNSRKAPGPDGITLGIIKHIPAGLVDFVTETFTACFREGIFPKVWKRTRLVLIPKGKPEETRGEIKARPICLLNEMGKLYERVFVNRLQDYMLDSATALSDRQFEFRRGRSMVDTLDAVVSTIYTKGHCGHTSIVRGIQRKIANRVCSAYCTVSWGASLLLARLPPYELSAEERANVYVRSLTLRDSPEWSPELHKNIKSEERLRLQEKWIAMYRDGDVSGVRTRDAILPNIEAWMLRG